MTTGTAHRDVSERSEPWRGYHKQLPSVAIRCREQKGVNMDEGMTTAETIVFLKAIIATLRSTKDIDEAIKIIEDMIREIKK